ncbi:MAG: ribonuclease HI [Thainema sp.]
MTLPKIQAIYTDGACSGNPGKGGWGTVVYFQNGDRQELGGYEAQTTNNRMEMQAAIAALEYFAQSGQTDGITLYTDSEYVKNGITKWIKGWKKKGWKTSSGKAVLNQDLWETLDKLNSPAVTWQYVRGHAGNEGNERCDAIARAFSQKRTPDLRQVAPAKALVTAAAAVDAAAEQFSPVTSEFVVDTADGKLNHGVQSSYSDDSETTEMQATGGELAMSEATATTGSNSFDTLPREVRVAHVRNLVDTLHMADDIASQGYLITSAELADLMDVNASAVTSRGDNWVWRNWVVSRVRREGNQILWQLERID